jgi:hypothetical protein
MAKEAINLLLRRTEVSSTMDAPSSRSSLSSSVYFALREQDVNKPDDEQLCRDLSCCRLPRRLLLCVGFTFPVVILLDTIRCGSVEIIVEARKRLQAAVCKCFKVQRLDFVAPLISRDIDAWVSFLDIESRPLIFFPLSFCCFKISLHFVESIMVRDVAHSLDSGCLFRLWTFPF